jgi:hypothetical protein
MPRGGGGDARWRPPSAQLSGALPRARGPPVDYVDKLPTCQWCSFAPPEWRIFTPPLIHTTPWMRHQYRVTISCLDPTTTSLELVEKRSRLS